MTKFNVAIVLPGMRRESYRDIPDGSGCRTEQVTSSGDSSALQKHEVIKLVCSERGGSKRGDNVEGFRDESLLGISGQS